MDVEHRYPLRDTFHFDEDVGWRVTVQGKTCQLALSTGVRRRQAGLATCQAKAGCDTGHLLALVISMNPGVGEEDVGKE